MSLIQDALKRQSEESTGTQLPKVTAEIPEPAVNKKNTRQLPVKLAVTLFVGLIIMLTGIGIYLIKPKSRVSLPAVIEKPATVAPVTNPAPVVAATPEPVAIAAPPVPVVEKPKVETVVEPVKKEEPAPEIKPVWPELNLTGIAQSDNQSIAIINGKMLSAGRKLGEAIVKEVHETDVVIEYRGECRILYINE